MTTTPVPYRPFPTGRPPYPVNTVDSGYAQTDGEIVGFDDGGFVIVWNDPSLTYNSGGTAVLGQRFDALGDKVGGEVRISAFPGSGSDSLSVLNGSAITKLPNGNLAIVYTHVFTGNNDTWVRVVDPVTLAFVRNDAIELSGSIQTKNPAITSLADNSYVVSYTVDNGNGNTDIGATIVLPNGAVSAPFTVRDNDTKDADLSQLATLLNNNFVVVYQQLYRAG